jgi:hypothetical protein
MNNFIKSPNIYTTSDLALAAALNLFSKIIEIDRGDPKKVLFIFERNKNFDTILDRYWKASLKVDPQKYFQNLKMLKNRIYNP